MAKKTLLGVDIGYDQLKLALVTNGRVVRTATASMPENLMKEGRITSVETMSDLIKMTMKTHHIRAGHAAVVLPNEDVYVKNVKMPMMTVDQLIYNLPFEFNDYITGEIKDYVFDYAVLPAKEEEKPDSTDTGNGNDFNAMGQEEESADNQSGPALELMAVGAQREVVEELRDVLRKAGLKMSIAAPALCSYINLIRVRRYILSQTTDEFGILDLGYNSIRMYMFKDDQHMATRAMEIGMSTLDNALADAYGVDVHLAHTYLMSNFENCQEREECVNSYDNIAIELMRALNFYRFSNPDSALSDIWICGGGAMIPSLRDAIDDMLDMDLHDASELVPGGNQVKDCSSCIQAIGVAYE